VIMAFFLKNFLVIGEVVSFTSTLAVCLLGIAFVKQKRRAESNN